MNPRLSLLAVFTLLTAACSSVDSERTLMRETLYQSQRLANEITMWRDALPPQIPASVVESIGSFQERADETASVVDSLSDEARAGVDLSGLEQALEALVDFETSRIADASASARSSLLDQFEGLAENLGKAAMRARTRV